MGDGIEVSFSAGCRIQTSGVDEEVGVTEAEGGRVRIVGKGIIPWSEQEEEAQEEHVTDGVGLWEVGSVPVFHGMHNDG
jgi:hypothetical protein